MPIRYSDQEGFYWASVAAEGATTAPGAGAGNSFIDASLAGAGANSFVSMLAILYPGNPQSVDSKSITTFNTGTGEVTLAGAYKGVVAPIPAGVPYRIVTFRFTAADVAALTVLVNAVEAKLDVQKGATGVFYNQADVTFNVNAILAAETDVLHLHDADTRYIIRSLRLKCANPVTETVTVRLYELVNDALTEVDSFEITTDNFDTYHNLMDMFGLPHLAGDELKITVQATAAGPYVVTGQYSYAKTNV